MSEDKPRPEVKINEPLVHPEPDRIDRHGPPIKGVEEHEHGRPDDDAVEGSQGKHTLVDMANDGFEFFTTALICTMGRFDRDPVVEFNRQYPTNDPLLQPAAIDYDQKFFEGLGVGLLNGQPVDWDRRLYAIHRDRWQLCRDTIGGIAIMHRPTRFFAKIGFYEMKIVDPFALKKQSIVERLPTVTITVFGISSNNSFSYLKSRRYPQLPFLSSEPAKGDLKTEANAVLGPPPRPEELLPKDRP